MNGNPQPYGAATHMLVLCLLGALLVPMVTDVGAAKASASALGPQQYRCPDPGVQDASSCNRTCREAIGNALAGMYYELKGGTAGDNIWLNVDSPCIDCSPHPSYCCWPGVFCCSEEQAAGSWGHLGGCGGGVVGAVHQLLMRGFNLSGSLESGVVEHLAFLARHGLHTLDLSSNRLTGTIPASIGRLTNLTTINLGNNVLTGELPLAISNLTKLQHFYASFNRLSGTLAGRFCTKPRSPLFSLILRANEFEGNVDFSDCADLGLLDLSDNRFHGSLPVGRNNQQLIRLRANNNFFNDSIPDDIWRLPLLSTIELSNNDLVGTLSPDMGSTYNIVYIKLGNNSLTGTIPGNLTSNPDMVALELNDNPGIYGTFPKFQSMVGLRSLDVHNTSLSGTIPEIWGSFAYLEYVDISSTRMTCCRNQSYVDSVKDVNDLLPDFLRFDGNLTLIDTTRGVEDKDLLDPVQPTDLLCGSVQRNLSLPVDQWNVFDVPITSDIIARQIWHISAAYSWYKNCTCSVGFDKDEAPEARVPVVRAQLWCSNWFGTPWDGPCLDMHIFQCKLHTEPGLSKSEKAGLLIACGFMFILLVLTANLCMAYASKVRRLYMRARTRLQGVPKHGHMSLVVTDIEGYSDMFRRAPEVMYRALMLHNGVIRAAKFANCGFVLEQEGDSFTLAFYDAVDAVAFCLQAQQALLAVQWPEGLDPGEPVPAAGSLSKRQPSKLQKRLSQLLASGTRRKARQSLQSGPSATLSEGEPVINLDVSPSQAMVSGLHGLSGLKAGGQNTLFSGLRVRMGVVTGEVPSGTPIKSSALFQLAKVVGDFGNGGQIILDDYTFAAIKEHLTVLGAVEETGIDYRKLASGRSMWARLKSLCVGTSAPQPNAEAVALDMGAYCQVVNNDDADLPYNHTPAPELLDEAYDTKDQAPSNCCRGLSSIWQQLRGGSSLSSGGSWLQGNKDSDSGLVVGHSLRQQIGERVTSPPSSIGTARYSTSLQGQQSGSRRGAGRMSGSEGDQQPAAASGISSMFASFSAKPNQNPFGRRLQRQLNKTSSYRKRDHANVRLFQILAPSLAGRAHVWLNSLSVKDDWVCWDMPYFDAPGSIFVPLSHMGDASNHSSRHGSTLTVQPSSSGHAVKVQRTSSGSSSEGPRVLLSLAAGLNRLQLQPLVQPLPPVTMVFMAVEHPEQLVKRRRSFAPRVYGLLNKVVRDALRRCGGYLCRVQEGDLKFMVVFSNPVTALEWCLVVQEAAMYLAWPSEPVLLYPGCTMEWDERGRMVFRGPRIKMGVCEGVPKSILPDHCGRADYHGPSINMAARFMDKGAKGGQIACTAKLAQTVLAHWSNAHGALEGRAARSSDGACVGSPAAVSAAFDLAESCRHASTGSQAWQQLPPSTGGVANSNDAADGLRQLSLEPERSSPTPFADVHLQCRRTSDGNCSTSVSAAREESGCGSGSVPAVRVGAPIGTVGEHSSSVVDSSDPPRWGSAVGDANSGTLTAAAGTPGSLNQQLQHRNSASNTLSNSESGRVSQGEAIQQQQDMKQEVAWPVSLNNNSSKHSLQPLGSKQQQQQAFNKGTTCSSKQVLSNTPAADTAATAALACKQFLHQTTAATTSLFKLTEVDKVPLQVEIHKLGIFSFKGGPPQQEMVQVMLSHLEGRTAFTESVVIAPSRKGQMLQKMSGRMGDPLTVQLPSLAQEYKAQLPERALMASSRVMSRSRTSASGRRSADSVWNNSFTLPVVSRGPVADAGGPGHDGQDFSRPSAQWGWLSPGSKTAAGPPASSTGRVGYNAAHSPSPPPPPPLASLRVMSDISSYRSAVLSKGLAASAGSGYLVGGVAGTGRAQTGGTAVDEAPEAGVLPQNVEHGKQKQVVEPPAAAARQCSTLSEGTGIDSYKLSSAVTAAVGGLKQPQDTGHTCMAGNVPDSTYSSSKAGECVSINMPTGSVSSSKKGSSGARECDNPASNPGVKSVGAAGYSSGYLRHDSFGSVHETVEDDHMAVDVDHNPSCDDADIGSKVGIAATWFDTGSSATAADGQRDDEE